MFKESNVPSQSLSFIHCPSDNTIPVGQKHPSTQPVLKDVSVQLEWYYQMDSV